MLSNIGHLQNSKSLITDRHKITNGFINQASHRNLKASRYVDEAKNIRLLTKSVLMPSDLKKIPEIQGALLAAAGISDKAANHLKSDGCMNAIDQFIADYLEPAEDQFIDELISRFLLTRGDTLGGSMRNLVGINAQQQVHDCLIELLKAQQIPYNIHLTKNKTLPKAIDWAINDCYRTLIYNVKVPFIGKKGNSVDMVLMNGQHQSVSMSCHSSYLALGELKGGIDPAGADEHWKTASSALKRMSESLPSAPLFYIGAAIEESMADEIWCLIESGWLANAANLTSADQLKSLCEWLLKF